MWAGASFLLIMVLAVGSFEALTGAPAPGSATERVFRVPTGASATAIGDALAQAGLVRSGLAFRLWSEHVGVASIFRAGEYRLSPGWGLFRMVQTLAAGHIITYRIAIPEGFTTPEIAARLAAAHVASPGAIRAAMSRGIPGIRPPKGVRNRMEGFLFPDTYVIPAGTGVRSVLLTMWTDFENRTAALRPDLHSSRLTMWQWVTLASVVQAEDATPADASRVAAVFLNRLRRHMPLQSDATVRYALGRPVGALTVKDLAVPSPYNTYRVNGLPVGPIDSPGLVALSAVLHPAHVPYLYFVSTSTGGVLFASTYAQQLKNIALAAKASTSYR